MKAVTPFSGKNSLFIVTETAANIQKVSNTLAKYITVCEKLNINNKIIFWKFPFSVLIQFFLFQFL